MSIEVMAFITIVLLTLALINVMGRATSFRKERDDLDKRLWHKCEVIVDHAYFFDEELSKFVKFNELSDDEQNRITEFKKETNDV